jgi:DNA (cytosine-5)-methyltransferase 1
MGMPPLPPQGTGHAHMTVIVCGTCGRPRCADTFSGEGGMGVGLQRAGWCCDAIDNSDARLEKYPLDCPEARKINAHALVFLLDHGDEYALRHTSPPCTGYSRGTAALPDRLDRYDRFIAATRDLLTQIDGPYVIENVEDAHLVHHEMVNPITLCWTHFYQPGRTFDTDGTPLWMKRHRVFESNVDLWPLNDCTHPVDMQCAGAYGAARRDKWEAKHIRKGGYVPSVAVMGRLLGIDWMSEKGLQLSIPPVYAQWIAARLIEHLAGVAA